MYLNSFCKAFLILFFTTFSLNASASLIQVSATYDSGATLDFSYSGSFGDVAFVSDMQSLSFTCPQCVNNESLVTLNNFTGYVTAFAADNVTFLFSFDDIMTTLPFGDGLFSVEVDQDNLVLVKSLGQIGVSTVSELSQLSVTVRNAVPLPATSLLLISGLLLVSLKRRTSALAEKA